MASSLRYAAVAAFISSATGFAVGIVPSPTVPGNGDNFSPAPTKPPVFELVKARLDRRDATNTCSDWTISGGYGQPQCYNSETCLFTSASGYYYEGCGRSGVKYNYITECYNYGAKTGTPPISQTYCPSSSPKCGFWAFIGSPGYTWYNFGCSTASYAIYVNTLPSNGTTSSVSTTSIDTVGAIFTATSASPSKTPTKVPNIGSHKRKKTPVGAIVAGVIGGLAVIGLIAALIFWFCIKKRTKARAAAEADAAQAALMAQHQREADAATHQAYNGYNQVAEIGGNPKPMTAYTPASPPGGVVYAEKPLQGHRNQNASAGNPLLGAQSPPPPGSSHSQQQYSELGQDESTTMGSQPPSSVHTQSQLSPQIGTSELGTGDQKGSYHSVPSQEVSELGGNSAVPRQDLSGASTGGLDRRPQGPVRYDMSGNPLHERFHELE